MTARSTRNKLRWQMTRVLNDIDRAVSHLQSLDILASEESDYINQTLPVLAQGFDKLKEACIRFREGL